MLEEEIYGDNSPIWEADFTMPASDGSQLGHQSGEADVKRVSQYCCFFVCSNKIVWSRKNKEFSAQILHQVT